MTVRRCPDCSVVPGKRHKSTCDLERCKHTGRQTGSCFVDELTTHAGLKCIGLPWTGIQEEVIAAKRLGYFSYWESPLGWGLRGRWVPCREDHSRARPDVNRMMAEARWDRETHRWVKRS